MTPFTTPEGPTVYIDLAAIIAVVPVTFQRPAGVGGQMVPDLSAPKSAALLGSGFQLTVRGDAKDIAQQVERAKKPIALLNS